jgi:hypothetical protein
MSIRQFILPLTRRLRREEGFTMIVAVLILFISSLIVTATFVAAEGDIKLTRTDTNQKKAYYAALAGISAYKYQMSSNAYYWKTCPTIPSAEKQKEGTKEATVPGTEDEKYAVKTYHSETHTQAECESGKQSAILETTGKAIGTFRIESTGYAGSGSSKATRSLVATFTHPGFLDYVYFTNYEILDPAAQSPEPTECEHYYAYRVEHSLTGTCGTIQFAANDKVKGPMHTNDAAAICAEGSSKPTFGRTSADKIEMNGGHYGAGGSCSNSPEILGTFTEEGPTLTPPETDNELLETAGKKFKGKTIIELKSGSPNTMKVTSGGETKTESFPSNGVIFVENASSGCPIKYTPFGSNYTGDSNCGNVYVRGTYTESLTIAAANDVIVNGNITTTAEPSGEPTGSATLGLIATNFVRIYHPVQKEYEVAHYTPITREPSSSKCPALKIKGKITSASTQVTNLTTTEGLTVGMEVSGTGIASATKITEIKSLTKAIVLSKAAESSKETELTFSVIYKYKGKITSNSTQVTGLTSTEGLAIGAEVSGTGIPASTRITEISGTTIVLNNKATSTKETELTFTYTFTYYAGLKKCVPSAESGYTFYETETLYAKSCESAKDTYTSNGHCEYQNSSSGCRAENLSEVEDTNGWGTKEMTIDAAILSTHHSFIVDNFKCGKHIGELNVWGSIAQFWRGPVGTGGSSGTGYTKNYNYDERLQSLPPPDFISPSSTS